MASSPPEPATSPGSCTACGGDLPGPAGECPRCAAAPPAGPPREAPDEEPPVPPLAERVRGVLLEPEATFARMRPGWGWAQAWLLVSCLGLLAGCLRLATVDPETLPAMRAAAEATEARLASAHLEPEQAAEAVETSKKLQRFLWRVGQVAGPPLVGLAGVLAWGGLLWLITLRSRRERADLLLSLCAASWCLLANGLGYLVHALALLLGNPDPQTSPAHLVAMLDAPALAAALGRLDPLLLWFYVLLAAALRGTAGLSARRAWGWAGGLYLVLSLLVVAGAGAASQGSP